jgi:heme/copper-type cytochrome/quinol oxidase subunit 2
MMTLLTLIGIPTHHSKAIAFQTPATPIMQGIVDLHNDIMVFLVFVTIFVLYLLGEIVWSSVSASAFPAIEETFLEEKARADLPRTPSHHTVLEII